MAITQDLTGIKNRMQVYPVLPKSWEESPCSLCEGTPCCSYLPLCEVEVETKLDLELLYYFASFQGIVPALKDSGCWVLYFNAFCTRFDQESHRCVVHGTNKQSTICYEYSPYSCWYRKAFKSGQTPSLIRFDLSRLAYILKHCIFDESMGIEKFPAWDSLVAAFSNIPLQSNTFYGTLEPLSNRNWLLFPPGKPYSLMHKDLFTFRLGFPEMNHIHTENFWCFALPAIPLIEVNALDSRLYLHNLQENLNLGYMDSIIVGLPPGIRSILEDPSAIWNDLKTFEEDLFTSLDL